MVDCHTHCKHSHDTDVEPEAMLLEAIKKGCTYYAFTDHNDKDYNYVLPEYGEFAKFNVSNHITETLELKEKYKKIITVGLGMEMSFCDNSNGEYADELALTDEWDILLNSVHTVNGHDVYYQQLFDLCGRRNAYFNYLKCVLNSFDAKYPYDVIAHLGYVTRKAPYGVDNPMNFNEFPDIIDEILKNIIVRDVSLEVNTHAKFTGSEYLPFDSIIDRYIQLGGVNFTYGSDAHQPIRVCDKYDEVKEMLLSKGIKYLNTYIKRRKCPIKII